VLCHGRGGTVGGATKPRAHRYGLTPIIFVFVGVLGPDQSLFGPRIVDTAIGAAIVLAIDYVLWLHARRYGPSAT